MLKSILCDISEKKCFICGRYGNMELHHAISGISNRKNSDEYGLTVYLCVECHRKLHNKREIELQMKQYAQKRWEEEFGTRDEFISIFGKSWL